MLRAARNARNVEEVKHLFKAFGLRDSPFNPYWIKGGYGAEHFHYFGEWGLVEHRFVWVFDENGNVKDYGRSTSTEVLGTDFKSFEGSPPISLIADSID